MSKLILEQLDNALDDIQMSHVHCDAVDVCVKEILDLRERQKEKEKELVASVDKMCAELSTEIRILQPNLVVSIKTNCIEIGYRTKSISCVVKPFDGCWEFGSSEFGSIFSKRYPQCRQLSCSLDELAKCIVEFFNNAYRSLS